MITMLPVSYAWSVWKTSEARPNALRMQLDPHFLFNALNTISFRWSVTQAGQKNDRTPRRSTPHVVKSKDRQEVWRRLAFLDHYLAIQKIRFGEHLKIEIRIAPEVKLAAVPCLLLQPLVENAIRHGISKRASGGTLVLSAERIDNRLEIRVLDDGVGLPAHWSLENSAGVGLAVTRQRIAALHPNGASRFVVRDRACGGTEVEIALPFNSMGEGSRDSIPA
jgi:LytS/YehU family sensor histidine kinase